VPYEDKNWLFLLHLSEMVDLIFAPKFTTSVVALLREVTAEHLQLFKDLYGCSENAVTLKPKHPLLVHLPIIILQSGPLTGMSCLRYELKNSFFKCSAHTIGNFTNVCNTLAYRHQQDALLSKLSGEHIRNFFSVSSHVFVPVFTLSYAGLVCSKFNVEVTDDAAVTNQISRASVTYKSGQDVIIGTDDYGCSVFGQIEKFLSLTSASKWFLVVCRMETLYFDSHFHSYVTEFPQAPQRTIVAFDDLLDHHAVCFIRLQYHVFKQ
jgi:hypothetical protein